MNWSRFLLAVVLSGMATSFTDWICMGVLFRDKYRATPELWRGKPGQTETKVMLPTTALGVLSCAAFIYLCDLAAGSVSLGSALPLAVVAWIAGPLPVVSTYCLWTRLHPLLGVSHSLGWLVRFIVSALIAAWLL